MVIDSGVINGVSLQLVPCSKSNNGIEDTNEKIDMVLENGVRTYKRRRNSLSSSENDGMEDGRGGGDADGQTQIKDNKDGMKEQVGNISEGSCTNDHQPDFHQVTRLPQHDVIMLEKYDFLCKLFSETFQGIKVENFSHFKMINSRMRDGSYSRSPQLLSNDIQELGSKFQKIGTEMISLAKEIPEEINQIHPGNINCSGMDLDPDQHDAGKTRLCMCCGGKTDTRSCIICDSCEKIYHIFCVGVSVDKESPRSWYCMGCVSSILDPIISQTHDNCNVCERVSVNLMSEDHNRVFHNGPGADIVNGGVRPTCCKLCRSEFENSQYRECEHYLCHNKFHLRCMSELELKRFGPRWYCPSCLCRVCLVDRDDEKIVLCDGCDNAYHIYCMEPPRSSIPEGKWFCRVCDTRLRGIRKAKKLLFEKEEKSVLSTDASAAPARSVGVYKNLEQSLRNITGRVHTGVGSVDMLLSAAETLKDEEKKFVLKEM
ncbi:hypothetical protein ACHQM5_022916 [Ranunculus cassubicifolius]